MTRFIKLTCLVAISFSSQFSNGQQQINHTLPFNSGNQSMWGPSTSSFSMNQTWDLFQLDFDESNTLDLTTEILGDDFGVKVTTKVAGDFEGKFSLQGFSTGEVNVNYPINVLLDMPTDNTYDQGDLVTIETSYTLNSGAQIQTIYPNGGEASLDLYFDLSAKLSAKICAFGCQNIPMIPQLNLNNQHVNIFTVNQSGAELLSYNGGPPYATESFTPFNIGPHSASPHPPQVPAPATLSDYGLTGTIDIPHVTTSSVTTGPGGRDLRACGQDKYVDINLDVLQLLSTVTPEPYGSAIENLSGSETYPFGTEVSWNFLSSSLDLMDYNKQCFDFTPKVTAKFKFPVAVEYTILNGGSTVTTGNSSIINVTVGHDLRFKFPCYYEELEIEPSYKIKGTFKNKTYDSIPLNFNISALEFGIEMDDVEIVPEIVIPEVCVTIPWICGEGTAADPFYDCTISDCTPEIVTPAVVFDGFNESVGPLFDETVNLANMKLPWFNKTWSLAGFSGYTRPDFKMKANPITISNTYTDVACNGVGDGSINVTVNAINHANPYSYTWSNGATTQDISGLDGGPYTLVAVDANGCSLYTGATLSEPSLLEGYFSKDDKSCNGPVDDGSIDVTIFGGTPPYSYSWSNGATTEDLTGLSAGTYTLTVTDAKLCTLVLPVIITEPTILGQNGTVSHVNCLNGTDGNIDVTPFGGTLPYSFSWSSGEISEDINNIQANNYTLTLSDANACVNSFVYSVTEPATAVSLTSTEIPVSCYAGNDGGIDVITIGGTPGYTYEWVSDAGGLLPYVTEDVSNIPSSFYTVIATDNNGCKDTISQTVSQPLAPLSTAPILTNILCFGDATGVIDPVISGGTTGYSYNWSNGSTAPIATNLVAGDYTLLVTDANGCTDTYAYTLTEPLAPLSLVLTGTDILCHGDATGSITTTTEGGTVAYSYLWNTGETTSDISSIIAGNYSVVVTDTNGCTISDNITLIEPAAPLNATSLIVDVDCYGNNSGSIDVNITGGTSPYIKFWSNSGTIVMSDTTDMVTAQYADDYTLLITDNNACTFTIVSTINEPLAPLAITGIIDDVNCFGLNDGAIDITVTGGTTNYNYSWSSGQTTEDLNGVVSGVYTITVTDFNSCTESEDFTIIQPLEPLNVFTTTTDVLCFGGTTGDIESTVTGGTTPYNYNWSTSETTDAIEGLTAGSYTLSIIDDQGCTAFTGATIFEPTELIVIPTVTDASCFEYSDGQIIIDINGGVAPYYLNWGNENEIVLAFNGDTLSNLSTNDYFVRVIDENGCVSEQFVFVGEPTPFVSEHSVTDALCFGSSDGEIDVTVTGGTPPYISTWNNSATTEDLFNLTSETYTYTIVDNQGCLIVDSAYVGQPDVIDVIADVIEISCIDQADGEIYITTYGGTQPYEYLWSNGETEQNISELAPGAYQLTVIDVNMCAIPFSFEIATNSEECLFIPNTFTPNDDNYNDTWVIENLHLYPDADVKVFNKWGNLIFSTGSPFKEWDGSHLGKQLPSDVYYYIIVLNNEEQNKYKGTVTIIR